jgi:hypothetical protein
MMEPPAKAASSFIDLLKIGALKGPAKCGLTFTMRILSLGDDWAKLREKIVGKQQHWLIHLIGVKPSLQKKGIGKLI